MLSEALVTFDFPTPIISCVSRFFVRQNHANFRAPEQSRHLSFRPLFVAHSWLISVWTKLKTIQGGWLQPWQKSRVYRPSSSLVKWFSMFGEVWDGHQWRFFLYRSVLPRSQSRNHAIDHPSNFAKGQPWWWRAVCCENGIKHMLNGERCKCAGTACKRKASFESVEAFRSCFAVLPVENEHFDRFGIGINEDYACWA